ncbi:dihydrofolate reductase family protein [Phytoactinopolyspora limicola]|uniref:dihydrofolate reductase family protein n=1 Tax=Phytoactinopolyspora limicola TaxID=2715536 RepID=UPI0014074D6F|nr:dihydrofolate reductase family protein [Phytoactinopolyspora limicola]
MTDKVFFSVSMSLDGYVAPESSPDDVDALRRGETTPGLKAWTAQWSKLQAWVLGQRFFRQNLKFGEGGKEGRDNTILEETFRRTGASVMGKRMFDLGEVSWPEEAPFHTPVYVVTHEVREPWERPGGTTFYFVNDGIESALEQARKAAGDRDVRIAGGGDTILQYLNAGLVDEFSIALSPVLFGKGVQLFDGIDPERATIKQTKTEPSAQVTHLNYAVVRT